MTEIREFKKDEIKFLKWMYSFADKDQPLNVIHVTKDKVEITNRFSALEGYGVNEKLDLPIGDYELIIEGRFVKFYPVDINFPNFHVLHNHSLVMTKEYNQPFKVFTGVGSQYLKLLGSCPVQTNYKVTLGNKIVFSASYEDFGDVVITIMPVVIPEFENEFGNAIVLRTKNGVVSKVGIE